MSEDCHSSGTDWTPEQFDAWKNAQAFEMLKAARLLRASINKDILRTKPQHLGRWEELTVSDFQFLYAIGVSCE